MLVKWSQRQTDVATTLVVVEIDPTFPATTTIRVSTQAGLLQLIFVVVRIIVSLFCFVLIICPSLVLHNGNPADWVASMALRRWHGKEE